MIKNTDLMKLTKSQLLELERFIIKRIEEIIFSHKRPSGRRKVAKYKTTKANGKTTRTPVFTNKLVIEDDTGKLRRRLRANKGFIKMSKNGLVFDIRMVSYYKYLDDERRKELNWYLTEAIFEDEKISAKIKELSKQGIKTNFIKIFAEKIKQS